MSFAIDGNHNERFIPFRDRFVREQHRFNDLLRTKSIANISLVWPDRPQPLLDICRRSDVALHAAQLLTMKDLLAPLGISALRRFDSKLLQVGLFQFSRK